MKFKVTYELGGKTYTVDKEAESESEIRWRYGTLSRNLKVEPADENPAPNETPRASKTRRIRKDIIVATALVGAVVGAIASSASLVMAVFVGLECMCIVGPMLTGIDDATDNFYKYRYRPPQTEGSVAFAGALFAGFAGFYVCMYTLTEVLKRENAIVVRVLFSIINAGLCAIIGVLITVYMDKGE
jgi:hypothetical protein